MTVKEIIKTAILFTNKTPLLGLSTFCADSQIQPTAEEQADIDLFEKCFNFVYKEIASTYFPLLEQEQVTFTNNKLLFSALSKSVLSVKKVCKNSKKLKFLVFSDHIFCEVDKAWVIYSALPADLTLNNEVNLFGGRVLAHVIAYGVAREFCYITGNYSDADLWESRFKSALKVAHSARVPSVLPKRRFL